MNVVSVPEAARQLGLSPQRVRAMVHDGQLRAERVAGRWLIDASSVPALRRKPGQPLSPKIAWALAEVAEGYRPLQLSASELSRVRSRWRALAEKNRPAQELRSLMARRAELSAWSAPDPMDLLEDDRFVPSGRSDPRSGMSRAEIVEGYVNSHDLDDLAADHLLVPARGPANVLIRVVNMPLKAPVPWLVVAADLADGDARGVQQAENLIARMAHAS